MRWIFIALSLCGLFFLFSYVAPHFWTRTFLIPSTKFAVSYGMTALCMVGGLAVAKLKFGK